MADRGKDREVEVVAYAGYKANERPLYIIMGRRKLVVREILDRWYGPDHDYYKVRVESGARYLLRWNRLVDKWFLSPA